MELTKEEHLQYKDLVRDINFLRLCERAKYRLSYKRERNNKLYYYLFIWRYKTITYLEDKILITFKKPLKVFTTYENMKNYLKLTFELTTPNNELLNALEGIAYKPHTRTIL